MEIKINTVGGKTVELLHFPVTINGEQREVIPAFTKFSIKRKDYAKDKLLAAIDANRVLPSPLCVYKHKAIQK